MKQTIFVLLFALLSMTLSAQQENPQSDIPTVSIRTLSGQQFSTSDITNDGKPIILSFWAIWCKPCLNELDAFSLNYEDWQEETGVRIFAVSIDDARSTARVAPYVSGKGWEFDVLLDANSDFKRAMNVNLLPHTFLLDGNGKIVSQHTSYFEGAEFEIYEKIKQIAGLN
jgi:cytochrome c biogenesis protein CcmG, thiol:disulfide interchange protein DsbE